MSSHNNPVSMTNTTPPQNQSSSQTEIITPSKVISATSSPHPNPPTFPILTLPLEIRNIVYGFALTSFPLRTHRYYHHWWMSNFRAVAPGSPKQQLARPSSSPSLNLLLTNRQIHIEASLILFREGCFLLPVLIFQNSIMEIFTPSPQDQQQQQSPLLDWSAQDEKWYRLITHLELEIGDYGLYVPHPDPSNLHNVRGSSSPLEPVLARFVHLKTITVSWQKYTYIRPVFLQENRSYIHLPRSPRPRGVMSLLLLEKLGAFERSRPAVKIMVRRPAGEEEEERMGGGSKGRADDVVGLGEIVGEIIRELKEWLMTRPMTRPTLRD